MSRTISIGAQRFDDIRERGDFFVDKTPFVQEWWDSHDVVTLICRPRRFGKTLAMSMVECFFSMRYANRQDLFEGLRVWDNAEMRKQQGIWPVIYCSLAEAKASSYELMHAKISNLIADLYRDTADLVGLKQLTSDEYNFYNRVMRCEINDAELESSIKRLCAMMYRRTGKKALVLVDEYDAPMQQAWLDGYWDKAAELVSGLFNATFKSNQYLERGLMTGVTRVARESIFSDLNNLAVITTTSEAYSTSFGFTEEEVIASMAEYDRLDIDGVKIWYDGFTFGNVSDIYNPWSITNYLNTGRLAPYWANTSSNALVSQLLRESDPDLKAELEILLSGGTIEESFDEQVTFNELDQHGGAIWSLLLASGYLKVVNTSMPINNGWTSNGFTYHLAITNRETMTAFDSMVREWFGARPGKYSPFVRALLEGDLRAMNAYMNEVALETFSSFDSGNGPSSSQPERFYHGFVLGLLVELRGRYHIRSNRESGFGRYDVLLEPIDYIHDNGIIIEFKVFDAQSGEQTLNDTVVTAQNQIRDKNYMAELVSRGVSPDRIYTYGFAFKGKKVLIG